MKKILLFSLALVLLCSAFVFAGGGQEEKAAAAKKLVFWFPTNNPKQDAYFNGLGPQFSQMFPEIQIETIVVPSDSAEIVQKLNTAKLAGTYPDVFSAFLIFIGTRGAMGEFLNIADRFAAWEEADDILPKTVDMGKYKGGLIGLGFFPAPVLKVYRKDFFREAGLDPNQGPETWKQYWDQAKKATVYDSAGNITRAGADVPTRDNALVYTEPFLRQAGSMVIDEVNQKPAFTDKGAVEALQFLTDMWKNKVSYPHDWVDFPNQPFINHRSAIGNPMVPTLMNMITNNPDIEKEIGYVDVMQKEPGGERWAFCGYRFFVIGATTKHPDEAWEFMKFMMSKDEMWKRYTDLGIQPVRKSLEQQFIDVSPERNTILARYVSFGKGKSITPWTSIADRYTRVAYEEALNGIKTPAQALKDAEKGLLEEIAKME
jgi:ABC-type glycerol-3-phosphate transport system substrate-binding protein